MVLSEVVARAGDDAANYGAFFSAASVLMIVIMVLFVCYFEIWSSDLLHVCAAACQPVLKKVKAAVLGSHITNSSSVASDASAYGEDENALLSVSTTPVTPHAGHLAGHDSEFPVEISQEQRDLKTKFEASNLVPPPCVAWRDDSPQIEANEDDRQCGGMDTGLLPATKEKAEVLQYLHSSAFIDFEASDFVDLKPPSVALRDDPPSPQIEADADDRQGCGIMEIDTGSPPAPKDDSDSIFDFHSPD